jgi:phosphodiesterase/alkaline phosphatase D-like protein
MQAVAGSGGQVACAATIYFKRTPGTVAGETGAFGKWQWRIVGGTFADITTEVASTTDAQTVVNVGDPTFNQRGSITVNMTKTGLTNGTTYEFRFLWRRSDVSGTAENIYLASGTLSATGS